MRDKRVKLILCCAGCIFCVLLLSLWPLNHKKSLINDNASDAALHEMNAETLAELLNISRQRISNLSTSIRTNAEGKITFVGLFGKHITQDNLQIISKIPSLEAIELGCCTNETNAIDEKAFVYFRKSKNLKKISIYGGIPYVTTKMCLEIQALKQLKELEIQFCPIATDGIKHLKNMTNLNRLRLPDTVDDKVKEL